MSFLKNAKLWSTIALLASLLCLLWMAYAVFGIRFDWVTTREATAFLRRGVQVGVGIMGFSLLVLILGHKSSAAIFKSFAAFIIMLVPLLIAKVNNPPNTPIFAAAGPAAGGMGGAGAAAGGMGAVADAAAGGMGAGGAGMAAGGMAADGAGGMGAGGAGMGAGGAGMGAGGAGMGAGGAGMGAGGAGMGAGGAGMGAGGAGMGAGGAGMGAGGAGMGAGGAVAANFDASSAPINDVSTDTQNPPQYDAVIALHEGRVNSPDWAGQEAALAQQAQYPGIEPINSSLSKQAAFDRALNVLDSMGLEIVAQDSSNGIIEGVDTTFFYRYKDDVVVRVVENNNGSVVDIRSHSRVGRNDQGVNAERVEEFINKF